MRKVVASLFISLDGVVEEPEDWHFPYFNVYGPAGPAGDAGHDDAKAHLPQTGQ